MKHIVVLVLAFGSACGSSSPSPSVDAPGSGSASVTLSITNFEAWCTVTEQSAPFAATMTFPKGTVVNLGAVPESGEFVWGYWTGTDGDTSASHDKNMNTTVTMSANKTVVACCPDAPPAPPTCM